MAGAVFRIPGDNQARRKFRGRERRTQAVRIGRRPARSGSASTHRYRPRLTFRYREGNWGHPPTPSHFSQVNFPRAPVSCHSNHLRKQSAQMAAIRACRLAVRIARRGRRRNSKSRRTALSAKFLSCSNLFLPCALASKLLPPTVKEISSHADSNQYKEKPVTTTPSRLQKYTNQRRSQRIMLAVKILVGGNHLDGK